MLLATPLFVSCTQNNCHKTSELHDDDDNDEAYKDYPSASEIEKIRKKIHNPDQEAVFDPKVFINCSPDSKIYTTSPALQKNNFYRRSYEEESICTMFKKYLVTKSNRMPEWLMHASMQNAPPLLQGIFKYLQSSPQNSHYIIPSYNRFVLVGEPGSGKTTLALAMACTLEYETFFVPISDLGGKNRGETAMNLLNVLNNIAKLTYKTIVILDEINKLFENYESELTDTSENSTAFWQALDDLEKNHQNIIIIGTANSIDKLPPQLKSRFHGKIINIPLPNKNQKVEAFQRIIANDKSIKIGASVDKTFINNFTSRFNKYSMRDIQLLVDAAKIFKYAEKNYRGPQHDPIVLEKKHFEQAFNQLEKEIDQYEFYKKIVHTLKEVSTTVHTGVEIGFLCGMFFAATSVCAEKIPQFLNFFTTSNNGH